MKITIGAANRQLREGFSKKTNKEYSFESFGIAPEEDVLMDINGEEFDRADRWLNGSSVPGVTEDWAQGDVVKVNIIRKMVQGRDGDMKEVLNFKLPEGIEPMVQKAGQPDEAKKIEDPTEPVANEEDVDPSDF